MAEMWTETETVYHVTLRDQFAMAALTGLLTQEGAMMPSVEAETIAVAAYEMADAMLAARTRCGECGGTGLVLGSYGESQVPCPLCNSLCKANESGSEPGQEPAHEPSPE